jgi:phosphomannomutase
MSDEVGNIIDGDQIIAAIATRWKNKKMLKGWSYRNLDVQLWFRKIF